MATYYTREYKEGGSRSPMAPLSVKHISHTLTSALANSSSDTLRVYRLPQGVRVLNDLCYVASKDDPDSGNNATVSLKYTDGTTTKTIIATGNLQAADTALTGTVNQIVTDDVFVTDNPNYYVYLTAEANDVDSGADLVFRLVYAADGN
jgi:hypothetical protein